MELNPDETGQAVVPVLACVLNQLCTRNDRVIGTILPSVPLQSILPATIAYQTTRREQVPRSQTACDQYQGLSHSVRWPSFRIRRLMLPPQYRQVFSVQRGMFCARARLHRPNYPIKSIFHR